jgi:hypothetical protein
MRWLQVTSATLGVCAAAALCAAAPKSDAMPTPRPRSTSTPSPTKKPAAKATPAPTKKSVKPTPSPATKKTTKATPTPTKSSRSSTADAKVTPTPVAKPAAASTQTVTRPAVVRSSAVFNTDYRTRPGSVVAPATLRGAGLNGRDLPIGYEDAYRKTLPEDYAPTDLMLVPREYSYYGQAVYLRREAAESLVRMFHDAAREGLRLQVVSGFRDIGHQRRLYSRSGGGTVARPGKSEHMLGTTADVTNDERHLLKRSFADTPEGKWLTQNAARYGWKATVFFGSGPREHSDEPWHIRYMGSALPGATHIASAPRDETVRQPRGLFSSFRKSLGKLTNLNPLRRHLESDPPNYYSTDADIAPGRRD